MIIPSDLLRNKKILLGVTGSIAVYKSLELVRHFVKAGAEVKVVMSESAKKFVTPLTFETLTSKQVLDDTNESWVNDHNHIKAGEWADLFVIAPATANTMAKLANAIADNMLLQCALAYPGVKLLSASANTNMLQNPITQANLKMLASANYKFVDTQTKELACKTTGDGAMAEPIDIFWASCRELLKNSFWSDRKVIVTGGGTIEKIDDVRYLSNYSSGKMASSLATALYCRGADVNLVATKFETNTPKELEIKSVENSSQMLDALNESISIAKKTTSTQERPYLFMAAAVSDYVPAKAENGKLKKDILGKTWELSLTQNCDILNSIDKEGIISVGFKAEMDRDKALENATNMLKKKGLNAVCLNLLQDSSSFGSDTNAVEFITPANQVSIPSSDKLSIAFAILDNAKNIQKK
ncbi:MAG: bifunctional phosphopantothenoylcysteine decarboxylase/phosphopantothenate--cysteine ligase CoaBC [Campylobacterota bacterium]|nr:bifunctional phosphopantothenoylcysteine decarboxylase/phosphopantothenate--cysteine ligase CoaBC [Campylobacterota bacterium]